MTQKSTGLVLLFLFSAILSHTQIQRRLISEKDQTPKKNQTLFSKEIQTLETKIHGSIFSPTEFITAEVFPLEMLVKENEETSCSEINNLFRLGNKFTFTKKAPTTNNTIISINGQAWERKNTIKYVYLEGEKISFENTSPGLSYNVVQVVQHILYNRPGETDTTQKLIVEEKGFYWLSAAQEDAFVVVYKTYTLGNLTQETKQVYAGTRSLLNWNNIISANKSIPVKSPVDGNLPIVFEVYPNPANQSKITISYQILNQQSPVTITLYDLSGREIKSILPGSNLEITGLTVKVIDIGNLPNGIYLLKLLHNSTTVTHKLVVAR